MSNPEKSWRGHTDLSTSPVKCSRFTFTDKYVLRRSASGGRIDSTCAARHTPTLNAVVCRCELDDCSERVQTSNFLSATVLSCQKSNSYRRSGRDTDKTVLSCPAWRCKLTLKQCISSVHLRQLIIVIIWYFAPPTLHLHAFCVPKVVRQTQVRLVGPSSAAFPLDTNRGRHAAVVVVWGSGCA